MTKHNIDNPNHDHFIPHAPAGTVLDRKHPAHQRAVKLEESGHLTFAVAGPTVRTENPDGTVTDTAPIARTYNPNPVK